MLILRSVSQKDLKDLLRLSELVYFINLPPDEGIIDEKIKSSLKAFKNPSKNLWENYYLFVLEDSKTEEVLGVSMIHAQHGTDEEPHFFLKVSQEHKFSETINTGFVHGTLKLGLETNGPTEIGGLIIHPDHRGREEKLGRQMAFVRFLYMAMSPDKFKPLIHSELMPPLDKYGNSPLWEAIGRRFMNMNYQEADVLSRSNKEFILSLYPSENIYQTLLPVDARNAIGKVGKETEPIKKMLESVGFMYTHEVDPFDGGPHYRSLLKNIKVVKNKISGKLTFDQFDPQLATDYLVHLPTHDYDFLAIKTKAHLKANNEIAVSPTLKNEIDVPVGQITTAIPFY